MIFKDARLKSVFSADRGRALNEFIARCQRIVEGKNNKCSIFFDGAPVGESIQQPKNVQVTFSYDRPADELMKSRIARSRNARNLIAVSDDIEIQKYARIHSCKILSALHFLNNLSRSDTSDETEKPEIDHLSIEEWLRLFNK